MRENTNVHKALLTAPLSRRGGLNIRSEDDVALMRR